MYVVMGGSGHVGSAVARTLVTRSKAVTITTHDSASRRSLEGRGFEIAEADVNDVRSLRAAYYMSNWDAQLEGICQTGKLQTMYPADFELPMVAPHDLGVMAADRLTSGLDDVGVRFLEGPRRYSSADVATAYSDALGQPVEVVVTPRDEWLAAYRKLGFSQPAAESYSRMTALALDKGFDLGDNPIRGTTTLETYVRSVVNRPQAVGQ